VLGGYAIYYERDDGYVFGIGLGPDKIVAGGPNPWIRGRTSGQAAFNTMDRHHLYRMMIRGASTRFSVFADNRHLFDATAVRAHLASIARGWPTVVFGGERGNKTTHYELDLVRYRRGGYAPGERMPVPKPRKPPPLPPNLRSPEQERWTELTDPISFPASRPSSMFEFKSAKPLYNRTHATTLAPCEDKGDVTVEWVMTVHPDNDWRGYATYIRDGIGTVGMLLSPDRVELTVGIKHVGWKPYWNVPIGIRSYKIDATVERVYRLVRCAGEFYWHLYVDDDPLPAIPDHHVDASVGGLLRLSPPTLQAGDTGNNFGRGHVSIKRLRWSPTAYAPGVR